MSRWPAIQADARTLAQRQKLAQWMAEWHIEHDLQEKESPPVVCAPKPADPHPTPLVPGHIALLQPLSPPLATRPRYLAVLDRRPDDTLLMAPFSRFSCPATPGELELGGTALPTRVLCVWNARWTHPADLPAYWEAGSLTSEERTDALVLAQHLMGEIPLPRSLEERIGPPVRHPLDPRHDYLDEEKEWMHACLPKTTLRDVKDSETLYGEHAERTSSFPMAAEERETYHTPPENPSGEQRPETEHPPR